jgi:hypothetical protein
MRLSRRLNYNIEDHGLHRSFLCPTVPKSVTKFTVWPPVTIDYDLREPLSGRAMPALKLPAHSNKREMTMAKTGTDLYRSVMDKSFRIEVGVYPGDGVLHPRWEAKQYTTSRGEVRTSRADVQIEMGTQGLEVKTRGGTSLHDAAGWFNCPDFWIPEGTEYSDEIFIRADDTAKPHPRRVGVQGRHYQLEPRTRMLVETFKGYLDNMARAAVALQVERAKGGTAGATKSDARA